MQQGVEVGTEESLPFSRTGAMQQGVEVGTEESLPFSRTGVL